MSPEEASAFLTHVQEQLGPRIVDATIPLLAMQHGVPTIYGTGTLLEVGGVGLVVTASHVAKVQTEDGLQLVVPVDDGEAVTLGGTLAWAVDDDRYDVAVVKLEPELVARFRVSGRKFLTVFDVEDVDPTAVPQGGYVLVGFPSAGARKEGPAVVPVPHYLGCIPFHGSTELFSSSYRPDVHFLLSLDKAVREQSTGEITVFPHPRGMSGCSVWWTYELADVGRGWKPQYARWVGIQSSVFNGDGALKIVPWQFARQLIAQQWPELEVPLRIRGPGRFGAPGGPR